MNKFTKAIAAIMLIVAAIVVSGCNKPDEPNNGGNNGGGNNGNNDNDVHVTTYMPQDITATTAKCGGDVIVAQGLSLSGLGVCWSTERNPTVDSFHLSTTNWNSPYVCTITGLDPSTNYYIRAYAIRGLVYYYGEEMNFTTLGGELPTVTTSEVTNITTNSAIGGGVVTSDGGVPIIEQGICWSTNVYPTVDDAHVSLSAGLGSFTLNMNNLEHSTLYYVRAYAKNYYGVSYGLQVGFTTQVAELPMVTTLEVTNIMANSAKSGGVVTSEGSFPVTERGLCWSTSSNPTIDGIHISSGSGMGTFNINLNDLERNTTYYVRAYAENYYGISYGSQVSFVTLDPPPGGSYNGHEYVDLGLPSGTLWATCNVGAAVGYGDYFAWGETQPKNVYNWSNYKYCNDDGFHLTKYCTNPEFGGVDHLTVLQAVDDAATVNWGSGWCIPTVDQWYELKGNTTCVWTNQNGMSGMLLISSNGNSLFLPASDKYNDNPPYWVGFQGHYHSSSLNPNTPCDNWNVSFSYTGNNINVSSSGNRCSGKSIRPVLSTK